MSKNLQKMMASKYPTPPNNPPNSPNPILNETPKQHFSKDCVLTPKKLLFMIVFLSILFFILSLPNTYKLSQSLFSLNSHMDFKCIAIHTILFAIISFIMFRFLC